MSKSAGIRANSEVAKRREIETAAQRGSVHRGDHRLREIPDIPVILRGWRKQIVELHGVGEFGKIEAGTKRVPLPSKDDDPDSIGIRPPVETGGGFPTHLDGDGVALFRSVQGEDTDSIFPHLKANRFIGRQ